MRKWIIGLVAALGLLLTGGNVLAQEATPEATSDAALVFCGDLAEADCAILQQSQTAMNNLTSAAFDFTVQVDITDTDSDETHSLTLTGSGAFANRPTEMGMDMMNPMAMMTALNQTQADLSLSVMLPDALLDELTKELEGDIPQTIDLQVRLVDGIGYVNADSIKPFLEALAEDEAPEEFSGWVGIDLARFFGLMMMENAEMMSQLNFGTMNAQTAAMMESMMTFQDSVHIERGDDANGAAVFTSTFDLARLAANPAFADMLREQVEAAGEEIDEEELREGLASLSDAGDALTITSTQTIDPATGYLQNVTVSFIFDGSQLPDMEAGDENIPTISLTLTMNTRDHNAVADISAPEDATMLPEEFYNQFSDTDEANDIEVPSVEVPSVEVPTVEVPGGMPTATPAA